MPPPLTGLRVLITQADAFMGPALCEVFAEQGATVIASTADLTATYLCSPAADCFVGQVFPVSGGWAVR